MYSGIQFRKQRTDMVTESVWSKKVFDAAIRI